MILEKSIKRINLHAYACELLGVRLTFLWVSGWPFWVSGWPFQDDEL